MIVSPSDVQAERGIVKDALYRWNELNSRYRNIVFSVLGYDINAHADSGMHPQESLNHQLLEDADLVIAIFWTKLGSPTTEYSSGSVEEITKHMKNGKKVLMYFSNKPVEMKLVNTEQYQKLQTYKASIQGDVFYKEYSSDFDFMQIISNDIQLIANQLNQSVSNSQIEQNTTVTLSDKEIMILTSMEKSGDLQYVQFLDGPNLNGRCLDNPREAAEIEESINKLENYGLIEATNYERSLFKLTAEGYRACDEIHKQNL